MIWVGVDGGVVLTRTVDAKNIEKNLMQMVNEYNDEFSNKSEHFESNAYPIHSKQSKEVYYIL